MTRIPRYLLPQIPSDKLDEFMSFLHTHGILSGEVDLPTKQLKPIQAHINREKVNAILDDLDSVMKRPILVSRDGYIIDGHHRWVAAKEAGVPNMKSIVCFGSLKKLIKLSHDFDHSYVKSVHEVTTYGRVALFPIYESYVRRKIRNKISNVLSTKYRDSQ